jgi:hypothetical protein
LRYTDKNDTISDLLTKNQDFFNLEIGRFDVLIHKLRKREDWTVRRIFFISANIPYDDQIYNSNLDISPTQAIIKRNGQNWSKHSKVTSLPKTVQPL